MSAAVLMASWSRCTNAPSSLLVSAFVARHGSHTAGLFANTRTFHTTKSTTITSHSAVASRRHRRTPFFSSSSSSLYSSTTIDTTTTTDDRIPVTLLSGFLGSGKTTALKNVLENKEGLKVGVIVNDVASVNIDAKLISNPNDVKNNDGTVELENGCACCTLSDELLNSVEMLCQGRKFDAVVVELSGVADPVAVKDNWAEAKLLNHPATLLADVNKIVTVVDSSTFGTDWMSWNATGDREGWTSSAANHGEAVRKVPELLAEQVESADVLIINKVDLAGDEQVRVARTLARGLNDKATLVEVSYGKVDFNLVIGNDDIVSKEQEQAATKCQDAACGDPDCSTHNTADSHSHSHDHRKSTSTDQLGIGNFVYKSDRPFDSPRLLALLNRWPVPVKDELDFGDLVVADPGDDVHNDRVAFAGVLRSKGFVWLAPVAWTGSNPDVWRHETAMYWSHAGKHFGITTAGKWWSSIPREQMAAIFDTMPQEYDRIIRDDWASEEFGDRRQEIVFIGTNLDEDLIRTELNKCLLTDKEMNDYRRYLQRLTDEALYGGGLY